MKWDIVFVGEDGKSEPITNVEGDDIFDALTQAYYKVKMHKLFIESVHVYRVNETDN